MDKNKEIKKLRNLSVALGLCATMMVSGCAKSNTNSFNDTMYGRYSKTCFDELVGSGCFDLIDELEKYISISNRLHRMSLKDNTSINDYIDSKLLPADDILYLIECYEDKDYHDVSKDEIRCQLYVQNKHVNSYIHDHGYSIMANATLFGLKARVADAAGLSSDEAYLLSVMDQSTFEELTDFAFSKVYIGDYDIGRCSDYLDLARSIYDMQNNDTAVSNSNDRVVYNSDRNKLIMNAINNLKKCLNNDYVIDSKNRVRRK